MRFTFERLLTEVLPPKQEDWAKVCFGRVVRFQPQLGMAAPARNLSFDLRDGDGPLKVDFGRSGWMRFGGQQNAIAYLGGRDRGIPGTRGYVLAGQAQYR